MIESAVADLLAYAQQEGLLVPGDVPFARNRILEVLRVDAYDLAVERRSVTLTDIDSLLRPLLDDAAARGLIQPDTVTQRDLWDTAIMGALVPRPSEVSEEFWRRHAADPAGATQAYHHQSIASNYIRVGRTDRNLSWHHGTGYGRFDITVNVSKPEKDPRDIAAAATRAVESAYPACLLCRENEGYAGRSDHPARQNLRLIPLKLGGESWFLQYSPYRYYNEHCIVLSTEHRPMAINPLTLRRLAEFTAVLPHYMVGSNADLPIVGGSILSHDHFQGGNYEFAMDRATTAANHTVGQVSVNVLHWPLAVLRLSGADEEVLAVASDVVAAWRQYDDPECGVLAFSGTTPHNTITPIARRTSQGLRMDLVLRNNRTSPEHPDGIFHPHAEIHPIKRENIGLIEVLGLAVLPGRLAQDLDDIGELLASGAPVPDHLHAHAPMVAQLREAGRADSVADGVLRARRGASDYFVTGLQHCGVFGADNAGGARRFLSSLG